MRTAIASARVNDAARAIVTTARPALRVLRRQTRQRPSARRQVAAANRPLLHVRAVALRPSDHE